MLLRHATLRKYLSSICRYGLLCCKSQGRLRVVWLHSPSESSWAVLHTIKRHGGRVQDVVILEVEVPRRLLRRNRRKLWYSTADVSPYCFRRAIGFAEIARPSIDPPRRSKRALALAAC
jgi:hypothetical protein